MAYSIELAGVGNHRRRAVSVVKIALQYSLFKYTETGLMVVRTQRRFIAGAVCPKCAKMDKLVVFKEDENIFRECVSCGYRQKMDFAPAFEPLPTRVDPVEETSNAEVTEPEVIKIVSLGRK